MVTREFKITLTHKRREYTVYCSRFQPMKHMMIRASIRNEGREDVYIFYEHPTKTGPLFWYPLPDKIEQSMAKAIAAQLVQVGKRRGGFHKLGKEKTY